MLSHGCIWRSVASDSTFSAVTEVIDLFSGTFAVVSLMTGSVVEQLVPTPLNSSSTEAAEFEAQRIGVASAVALLSGIFMVR